MKSINRKTKPIAPAICISIGLMVLLAVTISSAPMVSFSPATNFSTGDSPWSVATGDFIDG